MSGFSFSASVLWQGTLCEPSAVGSQLHAQCCATARTPTSCCTSLGSQILQLTCSEVRGARLCLCGYIETTAMGIQQRQCIPWLAVEDTVACNIEPEAM